ncbi:MAG: hypothetical protein PWR07_1234 [Bacillota bacterium]|nr:hypothetical protein [Bacillota bacterium]
MLANRKELTNPHLSEGAKTLPASWDGLPVTQRESSTPATRQLLKQGQGLAHPHLAPNSRTSLRQPGPSGLDGVGYVIETREVLDELSGKRRRLLVVSARVSPGGAGLHDLGRHPRACLGDHKTENRVRSGRYVVELAAKDGRHDRSRVADPDPAANTVRPSGPAGVDKIHRHIVRLDLLSQQPRIHHRRARQERGGETRRERGLGAG